MSWDPQKAAQRKDKVGDWVGGKNRKGRKKNEDDHEHKRVKTVSCKDDGLNREVMTVAF